MDPAVLQGHAWLPEPGFGAPPATSTIPEPARAPLFLALTCGKLVDSQLGKAKSLLPLLTAACLWYLGRRDSSRLLSRRAGVPFLRARSEAPTVGESKLQGGSETGMALGLQTWQRKLDRAR